MNITECIKNRRSVRTFNASQIPDEVLEKILDAGRWAPSANNSQPVEFIVVKSKAAIDKIRNNVKEVLKMSGVDNLKVVYRLMKESGSFIAAGTQKVSWNEYLNAPLMVIVVSDTDKSSVNIENEQYMTMSGDAGAAAIQTMMLAAYALGVGSSWLRIFDPERIKYWFGIPKTLDVAGIIPLGYPKYWPKAPEYALSVDPKLYPRRPLVDIVHQEKFDEDKWSDFQLHDPFRLPRKEFLRTEKYLRPTKLRGT